jgi:hypothetical protein
MKAHWKSLRTGESRYCKVTLGFERFVAQVNNHPQMEFIEWIKP